jgi:hypothetical protein
MLRSCSRTRSLRQSQAPAAGGLRSFAFHRRHGTTCGSSVMGTPSLASPSCLRAQRWMITYSFQ